MISPGADSDSDINAGPVSGVPEDPVDPVADPVVKSSSSGSKDKVQSSSLIEVLFVVGLQLELLIMIGAGGEFRPVIDSDMLLVSSEGLLWSCVKISLLCLILQPETIHVSHGYWVKLNLYKSYFRKTSVFWQIYTATHIILDSCV